MDIKLTSDRKDLLYMSIAIQLSKFSYATRKKVGGIVVKNGQIIAEGYNGTPAGWSNTCEIDNITLPEVIHAESNLITKLAKSTIGSENSTMYITLLPCFECSKLIYQSGINRIVFLDEYRNTLGLEFLKKCNISIYKIDIDELNKIIKVK